MANKKKLHHHDNSSDLNYILPRIRTVKKYINSTRLKMLAPIKSPKIPPTETETKIFYIKFNC